MYTEKILGKTTNREMKPHSSMKTARHSGDPAGDKEFVTV